MSHTEPTEPADHVSKHIIEVPVVSDAVRGTGAPLSPVVRANGFVFVSGLPGIDVESGRIVTGGIAEQTEASLRTLARSLRAAGSSLDKVVKATIWVSNAAHFDTVNAIYARFFPTDFPARTFVAVGSWPMPFDIEIECIALA
ncbi:RidA family protein [Nonomuraea lactucae]|uniref:RidA family protein n=1 Tax=Nonomuraea lactucae TaxID=2249762 RepID=UPI0019649112|nr:RidA family protein [Nonomuraea lactucae]